MNQVNAGDTVEFETSVIGFGGARSITKTGVVRVVSDSLCVIVVGSSEYVRNVHEVKVIGHE